MPTARKKDKPQKRAYEFEFLPLSKYDFLKSAYDSGYELVRIRGEQYYMREIGKGKDKKTMKKIKKCLLRIIEKEKLDADSCRLVMYK